MPTLNFPPSLVRRRSPVLVYGADDNLPWGTLLVLAAQHSASAIAFLSYVLVATRAAGLDAQGTQSMLAMTLIGMAMCTALQAWGGRWGSGFLLSHVPNPFLISFVATTLAAFGPGGMPLLALVYCAITLGLAPLITRMRSVFPTIVVGTVIIMGGLSLVEGAVKHSLAAFMPKITVSLMQIPEPVLGAVELYASAFLIVAGIELIASRAMDSRSTFAVGLSVSAGIAIMVMPQLMQSVPAYWRSLFGNALVVAGLLVIALNLLFRLGTSRKAQQALDGSADLHNDVTNFVEAQGAAWGARRDVVHRAALAAMEGAEGIQAAGRQVTGIRGSFDEFNLDLELLHTGAALPLTAGAASTLPAHELLDADDAAFEAALSQVSSQLLRHIADRVSAYDGQAGQPSALQLHFAH